MQTYVTCPLALYPQIDLPEGKYHGYARYVASQYMLHHHNIVLAL